MKVDKEWDMHHTREYKCIQNISYYTWRKRADIASGERIVSKWTLEKLVMRAWIGFLWQRMWSSVRHLWTQEFAFVFHERSGVSWVAEWQFLTKDSTGTGCGLVADTCEHRNLFACVFHERLGVSWVAEWRFLKKDYTVWSEIVIWKWCFCLFSKFSVPSHP
jgi:hypothetical protein